MATEDMGAPSSCVVGAAPGLRRCCLRELPHVDLWRTRAPAFEGRASCRPREGMDLPSPISAGVLLGRVEAEIHTRKPLLLRGLRRLFGDKVYIDARARGTYNCAGRCWGPSGPGDRRIRRQGAQGYDSPC